MLWTLSCECADRFTIEEEQEEEDDDEEEEEGEEEEEEEAARPFPADADTPLSFFRVPSIVIPYGL